MRRDDKHQIYTVRCEAVNAMLLNEFLTQHRKVEEQSTEIETLKEKAGTTTPRPGNSPFAYFFGYYPGRREFSS